VAIAPDGSWLTTECGRTMEIWAADGTHRATLTSDNGYGTRVAIAPDGTWVAAVCGRTMQIAAADGTPRVTVAKTGHKIIASVAIAPDGTWLATAGSADGTVRLWDLNGSCRATLTGHMPWVPAGAVFGARLAIAPDGTWLAAASGKMAMIWAADGTPRASLSSSFNGLAGDLVVAPDATWLALASGTTVSIFDPDGTFGTLGQVFRHRTLSAGSRAPATGLAVAPDGTWLATAARDTVQIWDVVQIWAAVRDAAQQ